MHLEKYPLAPSPSPPRVSTSELAGGLLADRAEARHDDPSRQGDPSRSRPEREPIRIGTGSISKRRAQIRYGCERALDYLGSVATESGVQSRLAADPAELDPGQLDLGQLDLGQPGSSHPGPAAERGPAEGSEIGIDPDFASLAERDEVYSSAAILAWLPTLPPAARTPLLAWLRRHLDSRGTVPFFSGAKGCRDTIGAGGRTSACVETTGLALLALWRAGELDGELLRLGAQSILRSGTSNEGGDEQEAGIFGSRWRRPPGSSEPIDPGVVVQALFPVLLALRLGRSSLVEPVDLGAEDGPFVVAEIVQQNLALLVRHLARGGVERGTERYPSPEVFLCLATELWRTTTPLSASLRAPLERTILAHWTATEQEGLGALRRAALLIAAENLHLGQIDLERGRLQLLLLQHDDGSFPAEPLMRFAGPGLWFGSRALTTAMALRALQGQPRSGAWHRG